MSDRRGDRPEEWSDRELVAGLLADDGRAVRYLFYEKCSAMFGYVVREIFAGCADRDELVNEFYLYLRANDWSKVRGFDFRSRLTTWLSVVATRFFVRLRRSMIDREPVRPLNEQDGGLPDRFTFGTFVSKIDLYDALQRLKSPRDRFVLLALEIEGYDEREVAETLQVTVANLYNIKKRAKERLSNLLKEYAHVDD